MSRRDPRGGVTGGALAACSAAARTASFGMAIDAGGAVSARAQPRPSINANPAKYARFTQARRMSWILQPLPLRKTLAQGPGFQNPTNNALYRGRLVPPPARSQTSSSIRFRNVPTPEISTSITSPGFIQSGGLRLCPTPSGVPVAITSPGSNSVNSEQKAMISGTE